MQPLLLRLVEVGEVLDPDKGVPMQVDIRIVAATSEDPEIAVVQGRFRQDLLFRLGGFSLHLSSLRARPDDVPLLMLRFLQDFSVLYDTQAPELSEADISILLAHDWPGNVRELRNVAERAVMMSKQGVGFLQEALAGELLDPASRPG